MDVSKDTAAARRAGAPYPNPVYAWYVASLLTLVYIVAYIDRFILSLLIEPIKASLHLSDFQMGLLIGPAFIILFVAFGIPLGWLADRKSRRAILAVGIAVWSFMTAACGVVKSFGGLFIARIGVGVGEASAGPCSLSLIGDYFPKDVRPRAVGLWMTGAPVGAGVTYVIGSQIVEYINQMPPLVLPGFGELYSWQTAFLAVGLPGLFLAALLYATVREPARQETIGRAGEGRTGPTVRQAVLYLLERRRAYGSLFIGIIGVTAIGGSSFWAPPLFLRTWGWDVDWSGPAVGLVLLTAGPLGTNFGGWLAARMTARGVAHAAYLTVLTGCLIIFPAFTLFPLMPTAWLALVVLFIGFLGMSISSGTSPSALLAVTPGELRGQATAVFFLVINLFGSMTGPPIVGLITDLFGDPAALKYGMSITCFGFGLMMLAGLFWGLRHYRRDAAAMDDMIAAAA